MLCEPSARSFGHGLTLAGGFVEGKFEIAFIGVVHGADGEVVPVYGLTMTASQISLALPGSH